MITMTTTQQNSFNYLVAVQSCASAILCGTMFTIVWQGGGSPLIAASLKGHVQVVAELLQHGARVDIQDKV